MFNPLVAEHSNIHKSICPGGLCCLLSLITLSTCIWHLRETYSKRNKEKRRKLKKQKQRKIESNKKKRKK